MRKPFLAPLVGAALALAAASPAAFAQSLDQPGSLLIFPFFDSGENRSTIITVTNTNDDYGDTGCDRVRQGDVLLHYLYFDGEDWSRTDVDEPLTPNDTLSVIARDHNPNAQSGFLVVYAQDPVDYEPIDFDYLIGGAIVVNTDFDFQWSYLPIIFNARGSEDQSECGHDRVNGRDDRDPHLLHFDGRHYDTFPNTLFLNQFFGEGTSENLPGVEFSNNLYLMSTARRSAEVQLWGWNNNEKRFSRTFRIDCFLETTLGDLTGSVSQGNLAVDGDDDELRGVATGWLKLIPGQERGPLGILGVFVQQSDVRGETFAAGYNLHFAKLEEGPGGTRGIAVTLPR